MARSVCWSICTSRLHFCIYHFHSASCQKAKAWLWLSMIHVGIRAFLRKTKFFSHFPVVIFPFTSDSITVVSPVITSSRVHSIKVGTMIVWLVRSSKLRRLFEMGVEMMRGEEYMHQLSYWTNFCPREMFFFRDWFFSVNVYHYFSYWVSGFALEILG